MSANNLTKGHIFECTKDGEFQITSNSWTAPKSTVILKSISVGICSSDFPRLFDGTAHIYPLTPGHEIYAEVVENLSTFDFKPGERVAVFPLIPCNQCSNCKDYRFNLCRQYSYFGSREAGALGSFLVSDPWNLKKIPKKLSNRLGNQVEPLSVVNHAFSNFTNLSPCSGLVISGSGFLTYLAIHVAASRGISNITVMTNNKWGVDFLSKYCNVVSSDEIMKIDFEHFLDFSGNNLIFDHVTSAIAKRGELVLVANRRADTYISSYSWDKILRKELVVQGSWNSTYLGPKEMDDWSSSILQIIDSEIPDEFPHVEVALMDLPEFLAAISNDYRINGLAPKYRLSVNVD